MNKKIFSILLILFLISLSACINYISFEEGIELINSIWEENSFHAFEKQLPHKTIPKKLSNSEFILLEEKLTNIEHSLKTLDQNLANFTANKDLYALKNLITLNIKYVSYLKKEKEFLFIFNDSILSLQKTLQGFSDENALLEECSSNDLKKSFSLLQELSSEAATLNGILNAFNKNYKDVVGNHFFKEKVIDKTTLFGYLSLFDSLQSIFEKSCKLQKDFFKWREDYLALLQEEDLCAGIDEFEVLFLKAKNFTETAHAIMFEMGAMQASNLKLDLEEPSNILNDLTEAEIELEKLFYSLKVSCGKE